MIKLFRHKRYKLMTANKTSRYLKYAFGEIILVMIGILLALQVNNWNEERKLQKEIITYLNQKLDNLKEDKVRLIEIRNIRQDKAEKSKYVLEMGTQNVDVVSFTKIIYLIVVERYFTTTIERNESSITKYYSGNSEAAINKLEQHYVNKIAEMKHEENRLNTFSENAEFILWTKGFLVENRDVFISLISEINQSNLTDNVPEIISNEANGQKALEGIFRRNEMANPSIVVKLDELIQINQQLIEEIERYIN